MKQLLKIDIQSYWHPGTGRGQGSHLDAVTHRNSEGLPCLPGRTLKGLLRDAVHRWESFGGYASINDSGPSVTEQLFGPYGDQGVDTWPGLLRVSDAAIPSDDVHYLSSPTGKSLVELLYRSHFSTAIEHDSGTADAKSLRGIELIVPLTLYAVIETVADARHTDLESVWPDRLSDALPLIHAVGAHRTRGLGRAVLTLEVL